MTRVVLAAAVAACAGTQKRDPDRAERQYLLGVDYFGKGLDGPALEETMKALEFDPENAEAHNLLGLIFLRQGLGALSLAQVARCLDGPAEKDQRAEADEKMGRARKEFEAAARLQENYSEAHANLSAVAIHFKEYDAAIAEGRRALSNILYRQPHVAYGNVGWAFYKKGDLPRAARELRQSVFHEPQFCVGHYRLAQVYYDQKEIDPAIEHLDRVVALGCPIQEAFHLAGMAHALRRDADRARQALGKCVEIAPKSCEARLCERDARLVN